MSKTVVCVICLALGFFAPVLLASTLGTEIANYAAETEDGDFRQQRLDIQNQLQVIDAMILERGPYGEGLDEAYGSLGTLLLEHEEYNAAAEALRQAWHLSRVQSGLYSEQQLAHLNKLIHALAELERWEEVHDLHQLGFLISSKIYPPQDVRYLLAAEFYSSWQWKAINGRLDTDGMNEVFPSVQELSTFYTEVIDKIEHAGSFPPEGMMNLVVGKARTDIAIARAFLNPRWISSDLGPGSYITEAECFSRDSGEGGNARQCRKVRLATFARGDSTFFSANFAIGRYLQQVEESIERLENLSQETLSPDEREWIEQLVLALREESSAILRAIRRV